MKYETELLDLMPMLRSYLFKIKDKYDGLVDADDLFQECLLNAVKSSTRKGIRNPRKYFIGVFDKTIKSVSVRSMQEFQLRNSIPIPSDFSWDRHEKNLIEEIDMRVKEEKPNTRRVWAALKRFYGDRGMVRRVLGCSRDVVDYHRSKLKIIYESVLQN